MQNVIDFIGVWLIIFVVPVFAVWTVGIPAYGFTFWFNTEGLMIVIAWFWLSFLMLFAAASKEE